MRIVRPLLFFVFVCQFFQVLQAQTFSIGEYNLGSSPIKIDLNDFSITHSNPRIQTNFIENTLRWTKSEKNLVTPQIILNIDIDTTSSEIYLKNREQIIWPVLKKNKLSTQVNVDLFSVLKIQIFENQKVIDEITLTVKSLPSERSSKHLIDYSCTPYRLNLSGLQQSYVSLGCNLQRMGSFGQEKPLLEVTMNGTQLKVIDSTHPTYNFYFNESSEIKTQDFSLSAELPPNLPRIRLAAGLGPYSFTNHFQNQAKGPETTFSYMLYGKLNLTETSSIKVFDALLLTNTLFNNSGAYYSFDLARLFDGRLIIGTLLGFQGLHYRYDKDSTTEFEITYPQGFEITYPYAFGSQSSYINAGAFLSTTQEIYKNVWIRFGQKVFYEINYIKWGRETSQIEMWGLSIGFPIAQLL